MVLTQPLSCSAFAFPFALLRYDDADADDDDDEEAADDDKHNSRSLCRPSPYIASMPSVRRPHELRPFFWRTIPDVAPSAWHLWRTQFTQAVLGSIGRCVQLVCCRSSSVPSTPCRRRRGSRFVVLFRPIQWRGCIRGLYLLWERRRACSGVDLPRVSWVTGSILE